MKNGLTGLLGLLKKRMTGISISVTLWSESAGWHPVLKKMYNWAIGKRKSSRRKNR